MPAFTRVQPVMTWVLCFLFCTWPCVIIVCTFASHQAGEHLYHTPNDAVWSWFAPRRPAEKNIPASCSHRGQPVSGGSNTSQTHLFLSFVLYLCVTMPSHTYIIHALTVTDLSQCCSALFVGDRDVPVLGHRHVPGDTPSPGRIHGQHGGGPVFAQRPGIYRCHTHWESTRSNVLLVTFSSLFWLSSPPHIYTVWWSVSLTTHIKFVDSHFQQIRWVDNNPAQNS